MAFRFLSSPALCVPSRSRVRAAVCAATLACAVPVHAEDRDKAANHVPAAPRALAARPLPPEPLPAYSPAPPVVRAAHGTPSHDVDGGPITPRADDRLSAEERQRLRREIHDAGRDLYRVKH